MQTPDFLKRGNETNTSRWTVAGAAAGGLAVGAVIGAGIVLGVQYAVRGFMGIPEGRASFAHPYGEAALSPDQAAFPLADTPGGAAESAGPATGSAELPDQREA